MPDLFLSQKAIYSLWTRTLTKILSKEASLLIREGEQAKKYYMSELDC